MDKVFISQMDKLEDFDIVELVDDETKEFKGYYLDIRYKNEIEDLWESEKEPRAGWDEKFKDMNETQYLKSSEKNKDRLDSAIEQLNGVNYISKKV